MAVSEDICVFVYSLLWQKFRGRFCLFLSFSGKAVTKIQKALYHECFLVNGYINAPIAMQGTTSISGWTLSPIDSSRRYRQRLPILLPVPLTLLDKL